MKHFDPAQFIELGRCPDVGELQQYFKYPSLSITYIILGLTSLFFAIYTAVKYNNVIVFDKPERRPPISNTWWIVYFLSVALRATTETTKFAVETTPNDLKMEVLVISSLVMYGLSTLALTLSLNHQRKYRSDFGPPLASATSSASFHHTGPLEFGTSHPYIINSSPPYLPRILQFIGERLVGPSTPFILLFLIYCISMYALFKSQETQDTFFVVFMVVYALQRLPVFVLVIWIVMNIPRNDIEGPSLKSKLLLLVAAILDLVNNLPVTIWAAIINNPTCLLHTFSILDVVHIFFCIAQIMFFIFLRSEFIRNKEQFVYTTVQTGKDYEQLGFDWRQFNH